MHTIQLITNSEVEKVITQYPADVQLRLQQLRKIIIATATKIDTIDYIEETLKWGEPSYIVKKGTTIRIDWKEKFPDQFAMYFSCSTSLIATFREIFKNNFTFEGNRAIIFQLDEEIPEFELTQCIRTALQYHKVKHLPYLGL